MRNFLFITSLSLFTLTAHAQEWVIQTLENAAPVYRSAFTNYNALSAAEREQIQAGEFPASAQGILDQIHQAAAIQESHWELPFERDGFSTLMPHLGETRSLARLTQAHAASVLDSNPDKFLDDQLAVFAMAGHVGRDGPLISFLAANALESTSIDALAQSLPNLPPTVRTKLAAHFGKATEGRTLVDALIMEKGIGTDLMLKKIRKAVEEKRGSNTNNPGLRTHSLADDIRVSGIIQIGRSPVKVGLELKDGRSFFLKLGERSHGIELISADHEREEAILIREGEAILLKLKTRKLIPISLEVTKEVLDQALGADMAKEMLERAGDSGLAVIQMLEETSKDFDRIVNAVALPPSEFEEWNEAWERNQKNLNPLSRSIMPAIDAVWRSAARMDIRQDMLQIGLSIVKAGEGMVRHSQDPYGDGPYIYRKTESGFELESKFKFRDKPVTLRFGHP